MEQERKEDDVNAVAEISAELERERQKNAELMERISVLEAQIRERNTETQENNQHVAGRSFKNFKRKKVETVDDEMENMNIVKREYKPDYTEANVLKEIINSENPLLNWMSMDDSQILHFEKFKECDSVAVFNETNIDDACNDNCFDDMDNNQIPQGIDDTAETVSAQKGYIVDHIDDESYVTSMKKNYVHVNDPSPTMRLEVQENQKTRDMLLAQQSEKVEVKTRQGNEIKEAAAFEVPPLGSASISQNKKPQKVAFCPKEVKRIIESEALEQKNAQTHTIRKIIVFASLGIRHGCEDMHELDFNHFSILKKGEPYVSPKNIGEHVLYENPGVRRKIFYPNQQNRSLCPVQILEEERAMRPSDAADCPSCLFLCIKYGGRTRNLPQNEYVRQRMGRNKLKSFGPLMCRMAMLVHVRSGSFFFKALGITLLFMAGFPGDLVQKETKYQNLDLLQKYYRTDEDAEGEDLFLQHIIAYNNGTREPQNSTKKVLPAKSKKRMNSNAVIKSNDLQNPPPQQPTPTKMSSAATQFGLTGYSSTPSQTYAMQMTPFHSMPSQISQNSSHMPNPALAPYSTNISGNISLHQMLPPQPAASTFLPVMYWPPLPPTAFFPGPYPSTFGYHSLPSTASYMSFQTQPYYYNHPTCNFSLEKLLDGRVKNESTSDETESDTDSSGGCTEHKQGT
ncbi:unnamed protein product [Trifolium pratense]|uniref:Uncharacterized protein n=1 Tax=Trifolium pratense TaxID=57577 RepID=A0ACB0JZB1_TRIPR|nr:unnamed protein product [Trifolium pratense]